MPGEISKNISSRESEVAKFYDGKSVFITGACGFIGQVLLEVLLRCCPGIVRIYILLRPKKGLEPEDRKAKLFKSEIFHKLIENNPDALNKVVAVSGDVSQDNLGMSEKDVFRITQEVSVVFHCAASVSFLKPISFLMVQNVIGTDNIIALCKKVTKLEALVYTSTLYSNSNRKNGINEIVYKLPFKAEEVVRLARNGDVDGLDHLYSMCNPNFLNFYTFSKSVSENLLAEKACDLPVAIIRPSVVINCMKGALPGYIKRGAAYYYLVRAIGKGLIRVFQDHGKYGVEYIPADFTANAHVLAAAAQANKGLSSPTVYNCTSGTVSPITFKELMISVVEMVSKYPMPNCYILPSVTMCTNPTMYKILTFIYHYLPAKIIDVFMWIAGKDMGLVKLYTFHERVSSAFEHFLKRQWGFTCDNFVSLSKNLNETDAEIFCVDMREFDTEKMQSCIRSGSPMYRVNDTVYEDNVKDRFV